MEREETLRQRTLRWTVLSTSAKALMQRRGEKRKREEGEQENEMSGEFHRSRERFSHSH
jgi:hypothetical protein